MDQLSFRGAYWLQCGSPVVSDSFTQWKTIVATTYLRVTVKKKRKKLQRRKKRKNHQRRNLLSRYGDIKNVFKRVLWVTYPTLLLQLAYNAWVTSSKSALKDLRKEKKKQKKEERKRAKRELQRQQGKKQQIFTAASYLHLQPVIRFI